MSVQFPSPSVGGNVPSGKITFSPNISSEEANLITRLHSQPAEHLKPMRVFKLADACNHANDQVYADPRFKNTCSVAQYKDLTWTDIDTDVDEFKEDLLDAVRNDTRPFVAIFRPGASPSDVLGVTLLKIGAKSGDDQLFDSKTGGFVSLTDDKIEDIQKTLKPDHQMVFFNKSKSDQPVPYTPTFLHSKETSQAVSENEVFFHQSQETTESICGVCSANNFFGKEIVTPDHLSQFNVDFYSKAFGMLPASLAAGAQPAVGSIIDASEGNDPKALTAYIQDLARQSKVDKKYLDTQMFSCRACQAKAKQLQGSGVSDVKNADLEHVKKLEKKVDRMILARSGGTMLAHFLTFRKTTEGVWKKVDSLGKEQNVQKPSEYIAMLFEHGWSDTVDCIYAK